MARQSQMRSEQTLPEREPYWCVHNEGWSMNTPFEKPLTPEYPDEGEDDLPGVCLRIVNRKHWHRTSADAERSRHLPFPGP